MSCRSQDESFSVMDINNRCFDKTILKDEGTPLFRLATVFSVCPLNLN